MTQDTLKTNSPNTQPVKVNKPFFEDYCPKCEHYEAREHKLKACRTHCKLYDLHCAASFTNAVWRNSRQKCCNYGADFKAVQL